MTRFGLIGLAVATVLVTGAPAGAQVYKLSENDGTIHFTNAPTDPRYRSLAGYPSGTAAGWLRLARVDTARYGSEIKDASERYGVPERLVHAVIRVESAFNPRAVSVKGAQGLMQLMPETASMLGVRNSFDPQQNIDGGVRHLRGLIDRFGNDLPLALAAYNAGEKAVVNHRSLRRQHERTGRRAHRGLSDGRRRRHDRLHEHPAPRPPLTRPTPSSTAATGSRSFLEPGGQGRRHHRQQPSVQDQPPVRSVLDGDVVRREWKVVVPTSRPLLIRGPGNDQQRACDAPHDDSSLPLVPGEARFRA